MSLVRTFIFNEPCPPDQPDSPLVGKPVRLKAGLEWEREEGNTTGWRCVKHAPPFVWLVQEGQQGGRVTNEAWVEGAA